MNDNLKIELPPNPYVRSPIKKLSDLAGRTREQKTIRYYLGLTATGQSPHLALIGQRAIGKTSLLNATEQIANELKLVPVRIDLNEQKVRAPARFWLDMYQALILSAAKAGIWGGLQGKIYADIFKMLYGHVPGKVEEAVLQVPYLYSCHKANLEDLVCPDSLIVNDLSICVAALQVVNIKGIAFLIDEADCLRANMPLLQMIRNVFQAVDRCSLILAGTGAVFPALSEVFSPIPRQFHKLELRAFTNWSDTMELVQHPTLRLLNEDVTPSFEGVRELHDLCGGDPDEIQLYCHHMYRTLENGSATRMTLSPRVYRDVLGAYRSISNVDVDAVCTAIEQLPDDLQFKSAWVSRRNLTAEENLAVSQLIRELKIKSTLTMQEREAVREKIISGYKQLHERGITDTPNRLNLVGSPLTTGFWKSYVNAVRDKRWKWDDGSFSECIHRAIGGAILVGVSADGFISNPEGKSAIAALKTLREGGIPSNFDDGMPAMIVAALIQREELSKCVSDLCLEIVSPAGKHSSRMRFFEKKDDVLDRNKFQSAINELSVVLQSNGIALEIVEYDRWETANSEELHRLGQISGYPIPDIFGPSKVEEAVTKFSEGDIKGCMQIFENMLVDKESAVIRNNLAFCQILLGNIHAGLENAIKAETANYVPLYILNKAVAQFLLGHSDLALDNLRSVWSRLRVPGNKLDTDASYVLVLDDGCRAVKSYADIPPDAAILINMWRMRGIERSELERLLTEMHPTLVEKWLAMFP